MSSLVNLVSCLWRRQTPILAAVCCVLAFAVQPVAHMPSAHAQTAHQNGARGCDYRKNGPLAEEICWLDFGGINFEAARRPGGVQNSIKLDENYTATFNIYVKDQFDNRPRRDLGAVPVPSWAYATFGNNVYTSNSSIRSSVGLLNHAQGNAQDKPYIQISNIRITDNRGERARASIVVFDAESTNRGEETTVESDVAVGSPVFVSPGGRDQACTGTGNPGAKTYTCVGAASNPGTFGLVMNNPSTVTTIFKSAGKQSVAFGVMKTSAHGKVKIERKGAEKIGDRTQVEIESVWGSSVEAAATTAGYGDTETEIFASKLYRERAQTQYFGVRPVGDPDLVSKRYRSSWLCRQDTIQGSGQSFEPRVASSTRYQRVTFRNNPQERMYCEILFESRFDFNSSLVIHKIIDGDAARDPRVRDREFEIEYRCTAQGLAEAYPDNHSYMSGRVSLRNGREHTISNIPVGSECRIKELNAFEDPSLTLDKIWTVGNSSGYESEEAVLTTKAGQNRVSLSNTYNNNLGKITITKEVAGAAADKFSHEDFRFRYRCGDMESSFTVPAGGTASSDINIPVETDCVLWEDYALPSRYSGEVRMNTEFAVGDGEYAVTVRQPFRLSATAQRGAAELQIRAKNTFDRATAPLVIRKNVSGVAAAKVQTSGQTFSARWECLWGQGEETSGRIQLTPGVDQKVEDIPIGADCKVWEDVPTDTTGVLAQVELQSAVIKHSTGEVSNADAENSGHFISISGDEDNTVIIENTYTDKLGTLKINKALLSNIAGTSGVDFTIAYECGIRTVNEPRGRTRSVALRGTVTLKGGQETVVSHPDDALVNDQAGGAMGIPFGNQCFFSESLDNLPTGAQGQVEFTTSGSSPIFDGNKVRIAQPETPVRVVNTITPTGGGVDVQMNWNDPHGLADEDVEVQVECRDPNSDADDAVFSTTLRFASADGAQTATLNESNAPSGWECTISQQANTSERTNPLTGQTYPVVKRATMTVNGQQWAQSTDGEEVRGPSFIVGDTDTVRFTNSYDYQYSSIEVAKNIDIAPEHERIIPNVEQKRTTEYEFPVVCTTPQGVEQHHMLRASAAAASTIGNIPVGSVCTIVETTPILEPGVELTAQVQPEATVNVETPQGHQLSGQGLRTFIVDLPDDIHSFIFVNTYSREVADVQINGTLMMPGPDALAAVGGRSNRKNFGISVICQDGQSGTPVAYRGEIVFDTTVNNGTATAVVRGIPVGMQCQTAAHLHNESFSYSKDTQSGKKTGFANMRPETTWQVNNREATTVDTNLSLDSQTNRSETFTTVAAGTPGAANTVNVDFTYRYDKGRVRMSKQVIISDRDLAVLREQGSLDFHFAYTCTGPDFSKSSGGTPVQGFFTTANLDRDFTFRDWDGNKRIYRYEAEPSDLDVHQGVICEVMEVPPAQIPDLLTLDIEPAQGVAEAIGTSGNSYLAINGAVEPVHTFFLTNRYSRALTNIAAYNYKTGNAAEAISDNYIFDYHCTLDGEAYQDNRGSYVISNAATGARVYTDNGVLETRTTDGAPVATEAAFRAPAGAICRITENRDSVQPRAELAVTGTTNPDRSPYTLFMARPGKGSNLGLVIDGEQDAPGGGGKVTALDEAAVDTSAGYVTADIAAAGREEQDAFKSRTFVFEVPAPRAETNPFGYEIVTEHIYNYDVKDITIAKTGRLPKGTQQDKEFSFDYQCENGPAGQGKATIGGEFVIPAVKVQHGCDIKENSTSYSLTGLAPDITWTVKRGIEDRGSTPDDTDNVAGEHNRFAFAVTPVANPAITAPNTADWAITVDNSYPEIELKKSIVGGLVSEQGTAVLDTAVLSPGQTSMTVTYRVHNPTKLPLKNVTISEPSLVRPDFSLKDQSGSPLNIQPDGRIDGLVCAAELAPGATQECSITVDFIADPSADQDAPFAYRGEAVAEAHYNTASITAADSFGAIRPPRAAFLLPNTGTKAMVWVLGLGLLVLLGALWNYLRRRNDDEANG